MANIIGRRRKVSEKIDGICLKFAELGHLDNDETPLQAAERETKEEAGLDRNDFEFYKNFEVKTTYEVRGKPKDVFYYLGRLKNPEQKVNLSDEHQDLSWANLQDACKLVKYENMINILRDAEKFIENL